MAKSKGGHTGQFGRDLTNCSYKGQKIVESTHRSFVTENGDLHKREGQMLKIESYNKPSEPESFWESVGNPHTDDL